MQNSTVDLINISIIVPAYNEAKRLPVFLESLIRYCRNNPRTFEIIVVDDGSTDSTYAKVIKFADCFLHFRILKLNKNMGKGYAVKCGLMEAKGEIALFIDADGSINPAEIERNIHYFNEGYDIVIGSRVKKDTGQILNVKLYRKIIGLCFNFFVNYFLFKEIQDTQCGFKIFRKEVLNSLFSRMYINDFGFDIELLYLADKMGYKIKEIPISWEHKKGGKVNLLIDSIKMFINILQIRNWHCTPINPINKYLGPDEYRYMYSMEKTHWWFVSRQKLVSYLVKSINKSSSFILDIGCGTGNNMVMLQQFGSCFGFDGAVQALSFCKKNGLKNIVQCEAEYISFKDNSFDLVTCIDVLEHIEHMSNALKEMMRVLKKNGRIIFTVPAIRLLWSQHDDALCHFRRFDKNDLVNILTQVGLTVEKCSYFFFASFFIVAPIRIIRRFFNQRIRIQSDTTTLPPFFLNDFLKWLFNIEIFISSFLSLPIGTTLYAVVSKERMEET